MMRMIYTTTKICIEDACDVGIEPELVKIMANSDNWLELKSTWIKWHKLAGRPIKEFYKTFYELGNKAAKMNEGLGI